MRQFWNSLPVEMRATTSCAGRHLPFGETMTNPVLVEVLRGDIVESVHRGAAVIVDGDGKLVREIGDIGHAGLPALGGQGDPGAAAGRDGCCRRIWFRRQGTGAGLRIAFRRGNACRTGGRNACKGRARRNRRSNAARIGLRATMRRCAGARRRKSPTQLHNNCSGKHAGFLCVCCHAGSATAAMSMPAIPFQEMVRRNDGDR